MSISYKKYVLLFVPYKLKETSVTYQYIYCSVIYLCFMYNIISSGMYNMLQKYLEWHLLCVSQTKPWRQVIDGAHLNKHAFACW